MKITIDRKALFQLMYSHSRLAEAEWGRNPAFTNDHFCAQAEFAIIDQLSIPATNAYFDYVDSIEKEKENDR